MGGSQLQSADESATTLAGRATPLWATLVLTFLASVGSLVVVTGVYYITTSTYKFGRVENYALGALQGLTYIIGAIGAGPLLRWLRRLMPGLSSRSILIAMMLLMAGLCVIPWAAARNVTDGETALDEPAHWPIWVMVLCYSPLTGMFWPMVESYVADGRTGQRLRSTIGWWNVVWSSSLVAASLWMALYVGSGSLGIYLGMGGVHALCAALLLAFAKEPLPHPHGAAHTTPPVYRKLLVTFRWLLPISYVVSSAMMPFLPTLMEKLGIAAGMHAVVGGTWLLARCGCFVVMERSKAWHGRWWHPALAMVLMLTGFAFVALCHVWAGPGPGRVILVLGLAIYGLGMAAIYSGAIYYAMEVGQGEVDAGGAHEGLIGLGYTIGPAIGLAASVSVSRGVLPADWLEPAVLLAIAGIAAVVAGVVARRIQVLGKGELAGGTR